MLFTFSAHSSSVHNDVKWVRVTLVLGAMIGTALAQTAANSSDIVERYCVTCHNQRLKTGGLVLDRPDPANIQAHAETWEKVALKLRLGMMPPQGMPRPSESAQSDFIRYLETQLDRASGAKPNPGRPLVHRLNRAEYANAIRDLLGFEVDVAALLPPDDSTFGFDNVADALGTSPSLLQAYLAAARKISAVAVGDTRGGPGGATYLVRQDLSQDSHIEGLPLGTIGGAVYRHLFPADGYYDFQVRLYRTNLDTTRGLEEKHQVELTLDGERKLLVSVGGPEDLLALQSATTDVSDAVDRRLRTRLYVKAGERDVAAAFLEEVPMRLATRRLKSFVRDFNTYDAEGAPHVKSITVQGPFESKGAVDPVGSIFSCRPATGTQELPCARRILATVARRAYRRPVTASELDGLLSFYTQGRKGGDFTSGIEFGLRRILAAPSFIYRSEREPASAMPGQPYPIDDWELASRLSFFLWSSIPDETLLTLAAQGRLHTPPVLNQQVHRMLADPRASALVSNFAGQWLQLRNLNGIQPEPEKNPDFDDNLRRAFRRETELFFGSVLRENRSVLDLMNADFTFLNERLARHYGIPGVFGSHFRRVTLTDDRRRGLLGKGAVLMVTSHSNSTSPVLRGKFVLENLLGYAVPPPPPDVPALKEAEPGAAPRTMREQMEQHRANPVCAGCHKITDPIGFALENFDETGMWRIANEGGVKLDTVTELADGTKVSGVSDLRGAMMRQPEIFARALASKLMVYALGRGLTHQDMPAVRSTVRATAPARYRFGDLISEIVRSSPFQMRMKEP